MAKNPEFEKKIKRDNEGRFDEKDKDSIPTVRSWDWDDDDEVKPDVKEWEDPEGDVPPYLMAETYGGHAGTRLPRRYYTDDQSQQLIGKRFVVPLSEQYEGIHYAPERPWVDGDWEDTFDLLELVERNGYPKTIVQTTQVDNLGGIITTYEDTKWEMYLRPAEEYRKPVKPGSRRILLADGNKLQCQRMRKPKFLERLHGSHGVWENVGEPLDVDEQHVRPSQRPVVFEKARKMADDFLS